MSNTSDPHQFGRWGEQIALLFIQNKGFQIIDQRYRTPHGEIDLIATNDKTLLFIEVKARRKASAMATALSHHQYQRAQHAAEHFLAAHPQHQLLDVRFDAIMVDQSGVLDHIENIWEISPF